MNSGNDSLLLEWLKIEERNPNQYSFRVKDVLENDIDREEVAEFCGIELVNAVRKLEFLREILKNHGLNKLLRYITERLFAAEGSPTWIGDFGEVLCTTILRDIDGHSISIHKLRYKEKQKYPMRLTDILTYKKENETVILYFSEVKTRTVYDGNVAKSEYEKLKLHEHLATPTAEILDFIQRRLFDEGRYEQANLFSDIYFGRIKPKLNVILFLVYEYKAWREKILHNLNDVFDPADMPNFEVRVIHIKNLYELINNSYEKAKNCLVPIEVERILREVGGVLRKYGEN